MRSKAALILKLGQSIGYFITRIFTEKMCRKYGPETSSRPRYDSRHSWKKMLSKRTIQNKIFFFYLGFLSHDIHDSQDRRERRRPCLVPLYHLHPLNKHLHISWTITADSSLLCMASDRTQTRNIWFLGTNY